MGHWKGLVPAKTKNGHRDKPEKKSNKPNESHRRAGHDGFSLLHRAGSHGSHAYVPRRTSVRVLMRLEHGFLRESLAAPFEGAHESLLRPVRQHVRAEGARARERVLADLRRQRGEAQEATIRANASK